MSDESFATLSFSCNTSISNNGGRGLREDLPTLGTSVSEPSVVASRTRSSLCRITNCSEREYLLC